MRILMLGIFAALLTYTPPVTVACLHAPKGYQGDFSQTQQQAIILHSDGREQLILKTSFRMKPAAGSRMPTKLAWVVPVPDTPDAYGVESNELFSQLQDRWDKVWDNVRAKSASAGAVFDSDEGEEEPEKIVLLPKVKVGEYTIQPIKTVGIKGGEELNAWLIRNGFSTVPAANMKYYIERDWIWLAVSADLGEAKSASRGGLRPLRISFASPSIVYPLLFSTHQGEFDVALWIVVPHEIRRMKWWLSQYGFKLEGKIAIARRKASMVSDIASMKKQLASGKLKPNMARYLPGRIARMEKYLEGMSMPAALTALEAKAAKEPKGWQSVGAMPFVYRVLGVKINGSHNRLTDWKEDFRIGLDR